MRPAAQPLSYRNRECDFGAFSPIYAVAWIADDVAPGFHEFDYMANEDILACLSRGWIMLRQSRAEALCFFVGDRDIELPHVVITAAPVYDFPKDLDVHLSTVAASAEIDCEVTAVYQALELIEPKRLTIEGLLRQQVAAAFSSTVAHLFRPLLRVRRLPRAFAAANCLISPTSSPSSATSG